MFGKLGDSVEIWTKVILYQFIEGQPYVGMPTGAKLSLALMNQIEIGCSSFKFKHYLRARTITWANKLLILYANNHVIVDLLWKYGDVLPTKNPIEWKENSIVCLARSKKIPEADPRHSMWSRHGGPPEALQHCWAQPFPPFSSSLDLCIQIQTPHITPLLWILWVHNSRNYSASSRCP